MAMKLQVPPRDEPLVAMFLQMSEAEVGALLESLREAQPNLDLEALADSIADRLSTDRGKARDAIRFLATLSMAQQSFGMPLDAFVSELRSAIEATGKEDLVPGNWGTFEAAIAEALGADTALAVSAKALDVLADNERNFCYARVVTELRPIFRADVEQTPATMVAVHTLKIVYHEDSKHHKFYVALDRGDIQGLIDLLQRAIKKEESLKALASAKNLPLLGIKS